MGAQPLHVVAPPFVAMAHRIVWGVAATVDGSGRPRTRVLHPVWEWDEVGLTGWIASSPRSPKARDLARSPVMSVTYWSADHDTCTADCDAGWVLDEADRARAWDRFALAPPPVGYDPALVPGWESPHEPDFGVLRLTPYRLRVLPFRRGAGRGMLLTWRKVAED